MKIAGINLVAGATLRRNVMLAQGADLRSRVANTQDNKKSAKKDRRNWKRNMARDW